MYYPKIDDFVIDWPLSVLISELYMRNNESIYILNLKVYKTS